MLLTLDYNLLIYCLFLGAGVEFADLEAVDAVNTGLQPSDILSISRSWC